MIPIQLQPLVDHVWQSTLFAVVAGALTLTLRNNRARVRYCLWFAASVKFLVPFSLLAAAGSYFGRRSIGTVVPSRLPIIADRFTESLVVTPSTVMTTPASGTLPANLILAVFGLVWTIGFIVLVSSWCLRWRRVRAVLKTASLVQLPINLKAMSSPVFMEPGVFGIYDPILLLPEGITEKLTPLEFEAILLHEMSHVRRRDNLATAIHMLVEAVFWFHPLVWFLGTRLMDLRERACDEDVLRAGNQPYVYAEGVLKVCELYLQSPLRCMSGVTGSNLKTRIQAILAGHVGCDLSLSKRTALTTAGILALAMPIAIGLAQNTQLKFEAATVKPYVTDPAVMHACCIQIFPGGRLHVGSFNLKSLISAAFAISPAQVTGGQKWMSAETYDVDAKPSDADAVAIRTLRHTNFEIEDEQLRKMLQSLLIDRFQLRFHRETKTGDVIFLERTDKPLPLRQTEVPLAGAEAAPEEHTFGSIGYADARWNISASSMPQLAKFAWSFVLHVPVFDHTGLTGLYDYRQRQQDLDPVYGGDQSDSFRNFLLEAGLKLLSAKGPIETFVIDSASRPSAN